ncbi:histidine kinase [Micromonospora sp. NPDC049559]|uniref:sensor histidine kinase n=1 Tax=Micromonospora sp. NPDC049559 TaxID=3155923 RepID=UPI0034410BB7
MRERWQRCVEWGRARPPLAVDALIALACYLILVINGTVDGCRWWVFLLAGANALPLLWRRRYPFTVTAVAGAGTVWLALTHTLGPVPAPQFVATYTFAALSPAAHRLVLVCGTVLGMVVSAVPKEAVLGVGPVGIGLAAAYALGTSARARRDRIAMLEERSRRLVEEQRLVAGRERERIAREMHDIIAHSMSLVAVQAEAGPLVVRSDPARAEEVFATISATARETLVQLRRVLGVLRYDGPERAPLPDLDAVPPLVANARRAGLVATLEEHGQRRRMPPDLGVTAYRIVQESLTNTVRHSGAERVRVRLDWHDAALRLEISDDGRGPRGAGAGGHGLIGMRERVTAAGGDLTTGAGPDGTGFRVTATLPLPR